MGIKGFVKLARAINPEAVTEKPYNPKDTTWSKYAIPRSIVTSESIDPKKKRMILIDGSIFYHAAKDMTMRGYKSDIRTALIYLDGYMHDSWAGIPMDVLDSMAELFSTLMFNQVIGVIYSMGITDYNVSFVIDGAAPKEKLRKRKLRHGEELHLINMYNNPHDATNAFSAYALHYANENATVNENFEASTLDALENLSVEDYMTNSTTIANGIVSVLQSELASVRFFETVKRNYTKLNVNSRIKVAVNLIQRWPINRSYVVNKAIELCSQKLRINAFLHKISVQTWKVQATREADFAIIGLSHRYKTTHNIITLTTDTDIILLAAGINVSYLFMLKTVRVYDIRKFWETILTNYNSRANTFDEYKLDTFRYMVSVIFFITKLGTDYETPSLKIEEVYASIMRSENVHVDLPKVYWKYWTIGILGWYMSVMYKPTRSEYFVFHVPDRLRADQRKRLHNTLK
tara:strand:+ start:7880 stop:9262 length:1383 start_codon:yes stop_codon:yes gene_type:complete